MRARGPLLPGGGRHVKHKSSWAYHFLRLTILAGGLVFIWSSLIYSKLPSKTGQTRPRATKTQESFEAQEFVEHHRRLDEERAARDQLLREGESNRVLERANELARQGKKRELIYNELAKQQKEQQQEHVVKKPDPEEALKDAIHPRIDVLKDIPRETALEDASKEEALRQGHALVHATADEGIGSEIGSEEVQKLKEPSEAGSLGSAPTETPVARIVKASPTGLFALSAKDIDGHAKWLSVLEGKVVLVVNVASQCGYTDTNYRALQALYDKYRDQGFEILAFPSNQFGGQEPGTEAEIKQEAQQKYHVTFPMFSKVDVNGEATHPIYQYLKRELPVSEGGGGGAGPGTDLSWNFNKYLCDKTGKPVKYYSPGVNNVQGLESDIVRLLSESRAEGRATV